MALAMVGYFWVQSFPRRVMIFTLPASSRACMRYPSSLISCSQSGPSGAFFTSATSCGLTQVGGERRSTFPRVGVIVGRSDFGIATMYQNVRQETTPRAIRSARHDREIIAMKLPQTGGCLCGKIRYEITEAPQLVYTCHCKDCQRLTSSAFAIAMAVSD